MPVSDGVGTDPASEPTLLIYASLEPDNDDLRTAFTELHRAQRLEWQFMGLSFSGYVWRHSGGWQYAQIGAERDGRIGR